MSRNFGEQMLISVIVPVYNVEPFIKECLDSILSQSYRNIEILAIDDGSTDNSASIIKQCADSDHRIKLYSKPNGGLADARNYGIDRAKGDFVTFIDSDDVLLGEDIFSNVIEFFSDSELDVVQYDVVHKWKSNEEYVQTIPYREYTDKEDIMAAYLKQWIHVSFCDKIFRKRVFDEIRFPVGAISEDIALIPNMVRTVRKIKTTNIGYYGYRYREGSITTSIPKYRNVFSAVESNYKYYSYAYSFPSLRRMVLEQYTNRVWNLISLARGFYPEKIKDILNAEIYIKLNASDYLRDTHGLSLGLKTKTALLFLFNPRLAVYAQIVFTKK